MYSRALKTLRQYHRLNQAELAEQMGISRSYLNEIENKRKEPSLEMLTKYADRFDVPLSSILLFAEQANEKKYEKARVYFADKMLKILEWVAETEDDEERDQKAKKPNPH